MKTKFDIYESPFSEETRNIRRNSLLACGLCLFIGLTENLPSKFGLLGLSFDVRQQYVIGWFILSVALYHFLHFLASGGIEFVNWIKPRFIDLVMTKKANETGLFDDDSSGDFYEGGNELDPSKIASEIKQASLVKVEHRLRYLYKIIFLKLVIEVLVPVVVAIWGLTALALFLACR
ncbi:MAG: hypothetical protein KUG82_18905 [Pseudomonadales bacterium]|nr:hypothetical protein [Pseudomonadales bacterium]